MTPSQPVKTQMRAPRLKNLMIRTNCTPKQGASERDSGNCGKCKCSAVCQTLLCANDMNGYTCGCAMAPGSWSCSDTDLILTTRWRGSTLLTSQGHHSPQKTHTNTVTYTRLNTAQTIWFTVLWVITFHQRRYPAIRLQQIQIRCLFCKRPQFSHLARISENWFLFFPAITKSCLTVDMSG